MTCTPLPPVTIGNVASPIWLQNIAELEGSAPHRLEVEAFVRVEVEHKTVGLFDVLDPCAPTVELDRAHLDAGQAVRRHRR